MWNLNEFKNEAARAYFDVSRWVLLNPCFVVAVASTWFIVQFFPPQLPNNGFSSHQVVEIKGWIARIPEYRNNHLYFELKPILLKQAGDQINIDGRIAVTIMSSLSQPKEYFNPPLRYGEIVYFTSFLKDPSYSAVPGTSDRRIISALKGIPYGASLKSPQILVREGVKSSVRPLRPLFYYLELFVRSCLSQLGETRSSFVFSAVLGRKAILPQDIKKQARRLGLSHLFAVSGFHLGIVAIFASLLFRKIRWLGLFLTLFTIWTYVLMVGLPVSALRAGVMTTVVLIGIQTGRRTSILNTLGCSALILFIFWPSSLFLPSFQFSFGCLLGIAWIALPMLRELHWIRRGIRDIFSSQVRVERSTGLMNYRRARFLIEQFSGFLPHGLVEKSLGLLAPTTFYGLSLLLLTFSIHLFLFPVLLHYSNSWSLSCFWSNLIFIPLFSVLIPLTLFAAAVFWTPLGLLLMSALDNYVALLLGILDVLSPDSDPFYFPQPSENEMICYYSLLIVSLLKAGSLRWIIRVSAVLFLTTSLIQPRPESGYFEITMLDVGQAESIHLRYPNGKEGLIDAGSPAFPEHMVEISERIISRFLWSQRTKNLRHIILTHPERDHIGALSFILRIFPNQQLYYSRHHPSYGRISRPVDRGFVFTEGGVWHRFIHPGSAERESLNHNDCSLVTMLRYGRFSALFTGDITSRIEKELVSRLSPVILLKIPHHGSRSSTSRSLLEITRPKTGWISAGRRNPFGHPSDTVLHRLNEMGVKTYSTSHHGSLRLKTDGILWEIESYHSAEGKFVTSVPPTRLPIRN